MAVFVCACQVTFTNPLPAGERFTTDKKLFGKWISADEDKNVGFIRFERGAGNRINISFFPPEEQEKNPAFIAISKTIGAHGYLILNPTDEYRDKELMIVRYEVKENQLTIWDLNTDKVRAAVQSGKLKGRAGQGPFAGVTVSDSYENIAAFVESPEGMNAFELFARLKKVRN